MERTRDNAFRQATPRAPHVEPVAEQRQRMARARCARLLGCQGPVEPPPTPSYGEDRLKAACDHARRAAELALRTGAGLE